MKHLIATLLRVQARTLFTLANRIEPPTIPPEVLGLLGEVGKALLAREKTAGVVEEVVLPDAAGSQLET